MAGDLKSFLTRDMAKKAAPAAKPVVKPVKTAAAPTRFDDADGKKPNPNGLYNRDGFMDRVPGKANSFTKPAAPAAKPPGVVEMERAAAYDRMVTARRKAKK